jgi:hypothetical protein
MRLIAAAVAASLLASLAVAALPESSTASATASARAAGCDPFTKPVYAGNLPDPVDMFGFDFGDQEVRNNQAKRYMVAADEASPRVRTGVLATTAMGRPVMYSIVGSRSDIAAAQRAARILRNPRTSPSRAERVAAHAPAIAFDIANVHGNEPSGADAALRVIRDIADRTDCAGRQVRKNVVTVVVPIQNPDGRWLDYRRNSYGFDMNRDWFARTQTETDGKVQLMRRLPPVLVIDDHEMGSDGFFFPPDADPVYHEIADRSIDWINNLYGAAMADEFDDRGLDYFNYSTYDMFYIGYGDTVPTEGFLSAGMTFEKDGYDPVGRRVRQQYIATWTSISALATHKTQVLRQWAASYRQAYREGVHGTLEPNKVFQPGSTLRQRVPKQKVRNYYILPSRQKAAEVQSLVRRLQRMDVSVRRLTAPLRVRDFHAYGTKGSGPRTLPRGTYWISMAQAQKHWIQAMMGEDTYVPFPYFYDVTAWSNPLLFNVAGGRSGATVHPRSVAVPQLPVPRPPGDGARSPNVGIWYLDPISSSSYESEGWMRWLYENKWYLPYQLVQSDRIKYGALRQLDVLVAPSGYAPLAWKLLGERGRLALKRWVDHGGRLVTMGASTQLAAHLGLTTARLRSPRSDIPGSLIHARVHNGPLSRGVGNDVWSFYEYDNVMHAPPADVAVSFPSARSRLWRISGYARGARELAGSAVVVDQAYGRGRVVAFAADPNYRAYTDGTQKILWNAIYGGNPTFAKLGGPARQAAIDRAREMAVRASSDLRSYANKMVITVRAEGSSDVADLIARYHHPVTPVSVGDGLVQYLVRTGPAEESRFANLLAQDLAANVPSVVSVRLPS